MSDASDRGVVFLIETWGIQDFTAPEHSIELPRTEQANHSARRAPRMESNRFSTDHES